MLVMRQPKPFTKRQLEAIEHNAMLRRNPAMPMYELNWAKLLHMLTNASALASNKPLVIQSAGKNKLGYIIQFSIQEKRYILQERGWRELGCLVAAVVAVEAGDKKEDAFPLSAE